MRTLPGLMSPWTIRCWWAWATAWQMVVKIERRSRPDGRFFQPLGQVAASDPFHDQERTGLRIQPRIEQARDVGVVQARQQPAFALQLLGQAGAAPAEQLDRHGHVEGAVGALAAIDHAHAADGDLFDDLPGAELLPGRQARRGLGLPAFGGIGRQAMQRLLEHAQRVAGRDQLAQPACQPRPAPAAFGQEIGLFRLVALEIVHQQPIDRAPARVGQAIVWLG